MKSKNAVIWNWVFSLFCILGFVAYFGSVSSFLFLLTGVLSLPIRSVKQWFGYKRGFQTAVAVAGFVIACLTLPAAEKAPVEPVAPAAASLSQISSQAVGHDEPAISDSIAQIPVSASMSEAVVPVEENEPPAPPENSTFQVDFLDVGQADAALIECDGHHMLIDGGNVSDSSFIYSYLQNRSIQHLDYIIGTHPHEDHIGGLAGALSYASADVVYSPVLTYDSEAFSNFKAKADENGGLRVPEAGDTFYLGSAMVEILGLNAGESVNDSSIILKITYGETSFLFTGDAEYKAEQAVVDRDLSATVLKVGHHGSDTSTSYYFLREVMPQCAVISSAQDNQYDHPSEIVLSRLRDAEVKVYRTDMQGEITCVSDGKTVTVTPSKNPDADTNHTLTDGSGQKSQQPQQQSAGQYIGNANSHKFHRISCGTLPSEKNRVYFDSRDAAINAGYVPCKRCNP